MEYIYIYIYVYYCIERDACRKSGRPSRKPDICSRNWSNTSCNNAKSCKLSGNFRRNLQFSRKFGALETSENVKLWFQTAIRTRMVLRFWGQFFSWVFPLYVATADLRCENVLFIIWILEVFSHLGPFF